MVSGIVAALAFCTPFLGWMCFFALATMFYILFFKLNGKRQAVKHCLLFALSFYAVSSVWIFCLYPITNFDVSRGLGFLLVFGAWLAISVIMSAGMALSLYIIYRINPPKKYFPWLAASMFTVLEFLQSKGPLGYTFGGIYLSQARYPFMIKTASVLGPFFITFIVVLSAAYLALAVKSNKKYIFVSMLILVANVLLGMCLPDYSGEEVSVSMVWENSDNENKMQNNIYTTLNELERRSQKAAEGGTDFILWTETSVPADHSKVKSLQERYSDLAIKTNAVLISGGFDRADNKKYSALFVTNPDGGKAGVIYKRHLVPFGEYIPGRTLLEKAFPSLMSGVRSSFEGLCFHKGSSTVKTQRGAIGGLVCYDSIIPALSRDTVNEGAQILMLSVNDSWFFGSTMIERHLSQAVFRAVENGRYVVRSTNQGVSAVINPDGIIETRTNNGEFLKGTAQLIDSKTPYTKWGDIIVYLSAGIILLIIVRRRICKTF